MTGYESVVIATRGLLHEIEQAFAEAVAERRDADAEFWAAAAFGFLEKLREEATRA